ncbi:helix-turn-helix domain-containing protein [Enterococcus sp. 5H]|uniref:helix-turn-helix domain-containing protein n=1 Tax=Enterococcus sp. 5H TaxID=1229490 RepID=UPI002302FF70|nr:helix-turn-helix transcriptional regulator [Enterococcus sp. 5H]MDA9472041.1 transcriptional regulator, Cro, CI family [Enterococcus sp. 5H]
MKYNELLIYLREELNIKQVDIFTDISSKSSYRKIESGEKSPTIDELISFCDRLGIRFQEFLGQANLLEQPDTFFGKHKVQLIDIAKNEKDYKKLFESYYQLRFQNIQYYSLFISSLAIARSCGYDFHTFNHNDIKELEKFYAKRTSFLGVDYEIYCNLFLVTKYSYFEFLTEKLFPVTESKDKIHDSSVQMALNNAISVHLTDKRYDLANECLLEFDKLRHLPGFHMHTLTNLQVLYLKHVYNFLTKRNIEEYLNALKIVNMFYDLGEYDIYRVTFEEVSNIASQENFETPKAKEMLTSDMSSKMNTVIE